MPRAVESEGEIIAKPLLGGLHHRYGRARGVHKQDRGGSPAIAGICRWVEWADVGRDLPSASPPRDTLGHREPAPSRCHRVPRRGDRRTTVGGTIGDAGPLPVPRTRVRSRCWARCRGQATELGAEPVVSEGVGERRSLPLGGSPSRTRTWPTVPYSGADPQIGQRSAISRRMASVASSRARRRDRTVIGAGPPPVVPRASTGATGSRARRGHDRGGRERTSPPNPEGLVRPTRHGCNTGPVHPSAITTAINGSESSQKRPS